MVALRAAVVPTAGVKATSIVQVPLLRMVAPLQAVAGAGAAKVNSAGLVPAVTSAGNRIVLPVRFVMVTVWTAEATGGVWIVTRPRSIELPGETCRPIVCPPMTKVVISPVVIGAPPATNGGPSILMKENPSAFLGQVGQTPGTIPFELVRGLPMNWFPARLVEKGAAVAGIPGRVALALTMNGPMLPRVPWPRAGSGLTRKFSGAPSGMSWINLHGPTGQLKTSVPQG